MKSLEEIDDAFNNKAIPIGSLVELILMEGFTIRKLKNHYNWGKVIFIEQVFPGNKKPGQQKLRGIYYGNRGYDVDRDNIEDTTLEFETTDGYEFDIKCSQIADYEVLYYDV